MNFTDLENDKIRITCDDDLKFFMEESPCKKLFLDFSPTLRGTDVSRKRTSSEIEDGSEECSKRIRKQMESIDLDSESDSSMDTNEDDIINTSPSSISSTNSFADLNNVTLEPQCEPSTSQKMEPNVHIISVDIIKQGEETEFVAGDNEKEVEVLEAEVPVNVSEKEEVTLTQAQTSNAKILTTKKSDSANRIVISDSSDDDETTGEPTNNRRHSDGPFASTYSFTNVNGNGYESRSSFQGGRYHHSYRSFRDRQHDRNNNNDNGQETFNNFGEQMRNIQRTHSENMQRAQNHARAAREHAARAFRASTAAVPNLVSTFQAHFQRPMFRVQDINQQIFGNLYRR